MLETKKTALLKQVDGWQSFLPIRGVARISESKDVLTVSFLNLEKRSGDYYLFFYERFYKIDNLGGQSFNFLQKDGNFGQISIIFYDGKSVFPVLTGNFSSQESNLNEVIESAKNYFKIDDAKEETTVFQTQDYDDEAIADTNYYEFENLSKGEDYLNERAVDNEKFNSCQDAESKEEKEEFLFANESFSYGNSQNEQEKSTDFYLKIKEELDSLFAKYPKEESLCNMVEDSKWVKIGDNGKYYFVGIIFKNEQPTYICYALPGFFGQTQSAKSFQFFIPSSPFNLKGEGYWVSFQNAKTGKCVEIS
ncbi:MAG: hypothetical protein IKA99_04525 [Clostridia bacterium]|nr:hypothetical protein [Clostridia bacterium]